MLVLTLNTPARDCADIIGAAQTGSGKTLAFGLPIMQRLLQVGVDGCKHRKKVLPVVG
jgi:ATP-dependent RNA helicase DDX24/MAK5